MSKIMPVLAALMWIAPMAIIVLVVTVTAGACVVSPSAQLEPGHCYRIDRRDGVLRVAGYRNVEVACP